MEKIIDSIEKGGVEYSLGGTSVGSTSASDLDIADSEGNVVARFSGGGIKTKNFDSSVLSRSTCNDSGDSIVISSNDNKSIVEINEDGIKTLGAETLTTEENDDYVSIIKDANDKMIEALGKDGTKHFWGAINAHGGVIGAGYVIVDIHGRGDYTSLQEAIYNVNDSKDKPVVIIVLPGTYVMDTYDASKKAYAEKRNLSIIGTNRSSCIIKSSKSEYTTNPYVDNAPLKLAGNVLVQNLTIICDDSSDSSLATNKKKAYCVHCDFSNNANDVMVIKDCKMVNNHFACIGIGLHPNYKLIVENCELESTMQTDGSGVVLCHESNEAGDKNEWLVLKNNTIKNAGGGYAVSLHDGYKVNGVIHVEFINNVVSLNGSNPLKIENAATEIISEHSHGNNCSEMNYMSDTVYPSIVRKLPSMSGKNMVATGDSITYGYTSGTTTVHNQGDWPKLLGNALSMNSVSNTAVGGATMTNQSGYGCIFDYVRGISINNYDMVMIAGGANDWQLGVELSAFRTGMKNMVDWINSNFSGTIPVVFITPINQAGYVNAHPKYALQCYRNIITEVVLGNDTYNRFSVIQGNEFGFPCAGDNADYISAMYGDKLHPTALGYSTLYLNGLIKYFK